jgi:hypothetical protein
VNVDRRNTDRSAGIGCSEPPNYAAQDNVRCPKYDIRGVKAIFQTDGILNTLTRNGLNSCDHGGTLRAHQERVKRNGLERVEKFIG